ncbi:hypothetical protein BACCAP_00021 [Pseudoflavonifractor capillosus ATCC 29799]|uniref:Uncharacterized protein n=1 Tax=Pseudoflavonifractor capillosus ATCC 29799 TaxID=411467 RepID=A6NP89_9FIRM|nr:hypothetical protein BACCAP_00021 [Pseudoflavonifractor capillosus ATCC 29799]
MDSYLCVWLTISIHAPRVGSDLTLADSTAAQSQISIHAPRVGSDRTVTGSMGFPALFQSTLPVWGATMA